MSQTTAKITVEGQLIESEAIPTGGVARIDPDLRNAQGSIVSPDTVQVFGPFLTFLNDDPAFPDIYGTFDVQNISTEEQDLYWCAEYLFSSQYGHKQRQNTLGPRGISPSPRPPVPLPVGVTSHGALTGLGADDHLQYALLAGRTGGQTLIGGTNDSNDLVLSSTSHANKGVIRPPADDSEELGDDTHRWAKVRAVVVQTGDLELKNEKRCAHWRIIEETDKLVAINLITGQRFRFALIPEEK